MLPKGSFPAVLSRGSSAVFAFLSTIVLARLLGAEGYGSYTFAVALLGLLSLVAVLGMDQLSARELGVALHERSLGMARGFLRWSNTIVGAASLFMLVASQVFLLWNPLGWVPEHISTARVLLCALPAVAFLRVGRGRLQAIDKAPLGIFLELTLWNLVILVGAGVMWFLDQRSAQAAALVQGLAFIVALAATLYAFHRFAPQLDVSSETHAGWGKMGVHIAFFALTGFLLLRADILLLGTIASPEETGAYGVAARSAGLAFLVMLPLQQILSPQIARAWRRNDKQGAAAVARRCARLSLLGTVPFILVYGFIPGLFLRLFGAEYVDAADSLRLLMVAQISLAVFGPVQISLAMTNKERWATGLTLAGLALGLPLAYLLYAPFGITGVALGRIASVSVVAIGGYLVLRRAGFHGAPWSASPTAK